MKQDLLLMVLEGLIKDSEENALKRRNLITALKLEQIDWFTFLKYWREMDEPEAKALDLKNKKAG